jgi:hypothetical protein
MRPIAQSAAALGFLLATTIVVLAQVTDPKPCAQPQGGDQNLSQTLGQSNGVICPPQVDPAIKKPTPNAGKMPVIPPPGSPGGNPNVQPK